MRKFLLAGAATVAMTGVAAASGLEPTLGSSSSSIINRAEPGKAIVRIDGYVMFAMGFADNTLDKAPGGQKADSFGFLSTFRIYPAFDAQTPGGLRYGAFAEVRSNNNSGGTGGGVGTSGQRATNTLYVNRAFGYIGGDSWGTIRFGSIDGPSSMMRTGTFEGQIADGGWNGWAPGMTSGVNPYRFAVGGGYEYSAQKITYMSPSWSGFQIGASFAPSTASNTAGGGGSVAGGGNTRQSASFLGSDFGRVRNSYQVAARYTGKFGGVGMQAMAGYTGSDTITNLNPGGVTAKGLSIFQAGATISYAGFMVGGYMNTGKFAGNFAPTAPGEKDSTVYTIGASYTTGPWEIGAAYLNSSIPGVVGNGVQRTDIGWTAGITYAYAPGARLWLEFVTGTAKERGVNLSNDVLPAGVGKAVNATAIILGNGFRW